MPDVALAGDGCDHLARDHHRSNRDARQEQQRRVRAWLRYDEPWWRTRTAGVLRVFAVPGGVLRPKLSYDDLR